MLLANWLVPRAPLGIMVGVNVVSAGLPALQQRLSDLEEQLKQRYKQPSFAEEVRQLCADAQAQHQQAIYTQALLVSAGQAFLNNDLNQARDFYRQGLAQAQEIGDWTLESRAVNGLGLLAQAHGSYRQALRYFAASLEISEEFQDFRGISRAMNNIALLWTRLGQPERALDYMGQSQEILLRVRHPVHSFTVALNLIWVNLEAGNYAQALAICNLYQSIAPEDRPEHLVEILSAKALCQAQLGLPAEAEFYHQETLKLLQAHPEMLGVGSSYLLLARMQVVLGNLPGAAALYEQSLVASQETDSIDMLVPAHKELSELYHQLGDDQRAYQQAWAHFAAYQRLFPVEMDSGS